MSQDVEKSSHIFDAKDTSQRNVVICSDGTWQKGGQVTPTNVWRTYLAVESENQFKFHDDGVGSGGNELQRIIGGAFGFGIPSRHIKSAKTRTVKAPLLNPKR